MTRQELLSLCDFGKRVAEEEGDELDSYFVETHEWRMVIGGDVDIIYGAKGSGKSAIYSLLLRRHSEFVGPGTAVLPAENPGGTPVFKGLALDPPASEGEFRGLWKIYFLSLVADHLRRLRIESEPARQVVRATEQAGLLPPDPSLSGKLRAALDFVRRCLQAESVETGTKIDQTTGMPESVYGKIVLRQPDFREHRVGVQSVDNLLSLGSEALAERRERAWILLDRLDVAFDDSPKLEANALRSLFRVYLDLLPLAGLSLKIFLRDDIWRRITRENPFREASHITKSMTINWDERSLLNLIIRRLLHNDPIRANYQVDRNELFGDIEKQVALFYRIFPPQLDAGPTKPYTLRWIVSRTCDGTKRTAPREVIHLLSAARSVQLKALDIGESEPAGEALISAEALKEALADVSKARFEQTLCAEYPQHRETLLRLQGEKTEQSPETLATIWGVTTERALEVAGELAEIGFFERRGTKE